MKSLLAAPRLRGREAGWARAPCHTCAHRTWRSLAGFMVMGCAKSGSRFGIAPDICKGHVNKAGGCVEMPRECGEARGKALAKDGLE